MRQGMQRGEVISKEQESFFMYIYSLLDYIIYNHTPHCLDPYEWQNIEACCLSPILIDHNDIQVAVWKRIIYAINHET